MVIYVGAKDGVWSMERLTRVLCVVVPIFTAVLLGIVARKRKLMSDEQMSGLQQFVLKFGLPCVLFGSCFTANISPDTVSVMLMVIFVDLTGAIWALKARKRKYPYHNLPMMFCAKETGMLGIPLFIALFGAANTYHIGVLDVAQAFVAFPMIAYLSADTGEELSAGGVLLNVLRSPLLIMSALGLILNVSGLADMLEESGWRAVISETAGFIAQPVSASMLFSVGYNFSVSRDNRAVIFRLSAMNIALYSALCALMQGLMLLMGGVSPLTRWAVLLFGVLCPSFLTISLGKTEEERTIASGVCSILTLFTLAVLCVMTVIVSGSLLT